MCSVYLVNNQTNHFKTHLKYLNTNKNKQTIKKNFVLKKSSKKFELKEKITFSR